MHNPKMSSAIILLRAFTRNEEGLSSAWKRAFAAPPSALRPQIHHAAGLAGGALDSAWIADDDLRPDPDVAANVRGKSRRLRGARGFVGVVGPRSRRVNGTDAVDP